MFPWSVLKIPFFQGPTTSLLDGTFWKAVFATLFTWSCTDEKKTPGVFEGYTFTLHYTFHSCLFKVISVCGRLYIHLNGHFDNNDWVTNSQVHFKRLDWKRISTAGRGLEMITVYHVFKGVFEKPNGFDILFNDQFLMSSSSWTWSIAIVRFKWRLQSKVCRFGVQSQGLFVLNPWNPHYCRFTCACPWLPSTHNWQPCVCCFYFTLYHTCSAPLIHVCDFCTLGWDNLKPSPIFVCWLEHFLSHF